MILFGGLQLIDMMLRVVEIGSDKQITAYQSKPLEGHWSGLSICRAWSGNAYSTCQGVHKKTPDESSSGSALDLRVSIAHP